MQERFHLPSFLCLDTFLGRMVNGMLENSSIIETIHFEIRHAQLKVAFIKTRNQTILNQTAEQSYCIVDNVRFQIIKSE